MKTTTVNGYSSIEWEADDLSALRQGEWPKTLLKAAMSAAGDYFSRTARSEYCCGDSTTDPITAHADLVNACNSFWYDDAEWALIDFLNSFASVPVDEVPALNNPESMISFIVQRADF